MIDFTRAFETAWERMLVILFRPFDFGKWFGIGFSAFLALLAEGGVNFNNPIPMDSQSTGTTAFTYSSLPQVLHAFKQFEGWLSSLVTSPWAALYLGIGIAYLVGWLALNWVGCRGEFVLLDNIVRNRAALAWPWKRYAHQGNVWFLFHIVITGLSIVFVLLAGGSFLAANWSWINAERDPLAGEVATLGVSIAILGTLGLVFGFALFLVRTFVQALYFKQTMSLGAALFSVARLFFVHPVSILFYLIVSFFLGVATTLITCTTVLITCCAIIWISCIPFLGSMLLSLVICQLVLPVLIFTRCFQLDCLAQFGPQYDVFTVDVTPQRPLG